MVRFAGKRLTGTLTSPNVIVPDQNGRTPPFSSPVILDSERWAVERLPPVRFVVRDFVALLGSAFSFLQGRNALGKYTIE